MTAENDWVVIDTVVDMEGFSASRPPQRNASNLSSNQFADATGDELADRLNAQLHLNPAYDPAAAKPPTVETVITDDPINDYPTSAPPVPVGVYHPGPARGLTKTELERHQHELDTLGWLDGATPAFTRHHVIGITSSPGQPNDLRQAFLPPHSGTRNGESGLAACRQNTAGGCVVDDVRAAGALFDEEGISPFVYASPFLRFD